MQSVLKSADVNMNLSLVFMASYISYILFSHTLAVLPISFQKS